MGYTEPQKQDPLKGTGGSMGDNEQRGYYGLLSRYEAKP